MFDFEYLENTLRNLIIRRDEYLNLGNSVPSDIEAYRESTVLRFILCFEAIEATVSDFLISEKRISKKPSNSYDIFRRAGENDYLSVPVETWFKYRELRNTLVHEYTQVIDKEIKKFNIFIDDCIDLYERMSGEKWKQQKTD